MRVNRVYFKFFFMILFSLFLSACIEIIPTETLSLLPGKDAEVSIASPDENFSDFSSLYVGYDSLTDPGYRTYLYFDLTASSLLSGAIVKDAYLRLHQYFFYGLEAFPIGLYQVTSGWQEEDITWNDQPDSLSEAEYICSVYSSTGAWRTWSIGNLVKSWLDGSITNYGILLKPIDEVSNDKIVYFYSSDSSNTPRLPQLVIEYEVP